MFRRLITAAFILGLMVTAASAQDVVKKRIMLKDGQPGPEGMMMGPGGPGEAQFIMKSGPGAELMMIPDLTKDQEKKIEDIRFKYRKLSKPVQNQIGELRARMHSIMTADKINKNDAYKVAEEINSLELKLDKYRIDERSEISDVLTEKQRLEWNDHAFMEFHHGGPGNMDVKVMRWVDKDEEEIK